MSPRPLHVVVGHLRRLASEGAAEPTDRDLLRRFAAGRDQSAFAALVERHGPMVWGVCRRALRHEQDAEDAFQATFLVLARKADSAYWRDSIHNWLYEVASRLAAELRVKAARRHRHEENAGLARSGSPSHEAGRDLAAALDEELGRLPARYREPLLLCYLDGATSDQAARRLGLSLRTLQRRLAQGRDLLRRRLTRYGFTLAAALLAPGLTNGAGVPPLLAVATVRAALAFTSGAGTAGLPAALAETALRGIAMTRWKIAALVLLTLGTLAGTGLAVRPAPQAPGESEARGPQAPKSGPPAEPAPQPAPFAHRLWAVMELVRARHPEPPSRAGMTLAAVKGVLKAAKATEPEGLAERVRGLETREQLTAFLKEVWPRGEKAPAADVLEAAALNGLFAAVPGEGAFWPPEEARVADQISGNRYVGIGIQLRVHPEEMLPQIVIPFRGGPAHRAGIKPDDLLVEVDGKAIKDVPLRDVVEMLRGEEGTTLTVVVRAPGSSETRSTKMTRTVVPFEHVTGFRRASEDAWDYLIDPKGPIGYVRVDGCNSSTAHELRQAERRLRAGGARAVVLDLRDSIGDGDLHNGTLVAAALLDDAPLWRLNEAGQKPREFRSGRDCLFRDWPMTVLVNDGLAAAEAAVVAALQDNGRAAVVGEPTRNSGFVNSRVALPDGRGAVSFRTGRLERVAKGRGWPVEPDHAVTPTKTQRDAVVEWLRAKGRPPEPGSAADKAPEDPQLDKAVELLRAALKKGGA